MNFENVERNKALLALHNLRFSPLKAKTNNTNIMLNHWIFTKIGNNLFYFFLILLALFMGTFFRFFNLNWDNSNIYHPDEYNILLAANKVEIPEKLNPEFFAYGGFSIYLYKGTAQILSGLTNDPKWQTDITNINIIGRTYSAIFSTLTFLLIFLFAFKTIGKKGAVIALFLSSFCVGFIQNAHYSVTESMITFFLMLIAVICLYIVEKNKTHYWVLLALVMGIAIGTKTSTLAYLVIPAVSWLILIYRNHEKKYVLKTFIKGLGFLFLTAIIAFTVSPYNLLDLQSFQNSLSYEGGVVAGTVKVPYTLQFEHTSKYIFQFGNLFWHTGIFLPIVGIFSFFYYLYLLSKKKASYMLLPLFLFGIAYYLYVGNWYAKFIRYLMPFLPVLIIASSWFFTKLLDIKKFHKVIKGFVVIVILFAVLYSYAFMSIYNNEQTRESASNWIANNIPANSIVLREHWEYALPNRLSTGETIPPYTFITIPNYDDDNQTKMESLSSNLSSGDYLIIASSRLYKQIEKTPEKYPYTSQYYVNLFAEKLGYKVVANFHSYAKIGPFEINDESAEETFQVFDHPTIFIFKNVEKFNKEKLFDMLYKNV